MKKLSMVAAMTAFATLLLGACSPSDDAGGDDAAGGGAAEGPNPTRNAYFGDLHVHTRYSFDAFIFGTTTDPNDAYEFAKGGTIKHPAGFDMQLDRPLDFQAVADHGMYLGMLPAMTEEDSPVYGHPIAADLRVAEEADERRGIFVGMGPYLRGDPGTEEHLNMDVVRGAWSKIVEAAEVHNDPGNFTAFIGYEFTSSGYERDNLHRNVIFRGSEHPDAPFSRLDSQNPEDLWAAMDGWRDQGIEALAIPHNSNGSGGRMFEMEKFYGDPFDDEYSDVRMRNEPIVEMTQVKGTSDTHPALSPNDEWADFEIMPYKIATTIISDPPGSYVRDALIRGLRLADDGLMNPYKFGLIGASDTHVSAGSFEEDNYWSKVGILDAEPQLRGSVPGTGANQTLGDETQQSDASMRTGDGSGRTFRDTYYYTWGASGLAGVWAEENTREAIFDAMRRKETFATSGPRMKIRFFAGDFADGDLDDAEFLTKAYAEGVPMGGDLLAADDASAPTFAVMAMRDSMGAPLQRLQVIKGSSRNGEGAEVVYDVACSDGAEVDPATNRCPDNGAVVDLATCDISADAGADELKAVWTDPDFEASDRAFYYVRALENPTCRWSTWDAMRAGVEPRQDISPTLQERAWSSAIWYNAD